MKILKFFIPVLFFCSTASAQYYYNDVMGNEKLNREMAQLKKAGFHKMVLKSFEDDDQPSEGFFCEKTTNKDYSQSDMFSKSYITGKSELQSFYSNERISRSINTTEHITNTTIFSYNDSGKLSEINISTFGNADSSVFTENRRYSYDERGMPLQMIRSKNGKQVSVIDFKKDENGNVIEENPGNSDSDKKYYYYYDKDDQLTDIVHFNQIAQKLLPDYMFLYNHQQDPAQIISVDESGRNYFIWKYAYDSYGLPDYTKMLFKRKATVGNNPIRISIESFDLTSIEKYRR